MNNLKSLPKITIVTPTYNQGNFIEQTINSVLNQDYPNLEYIVMDGGSTDDTLKILKKYDKYITWRSEKDRGQSDALNKGFGMGTGDIFSYINSDDLYEPDAFNSVGKFFSKNPGAHWLTGRCRIIDPHGNEIRKPITVYKNFWLLIKSYPLLLVIDFISQPATFWSREVIKEIGPFDETIHLTMDYDYSLRVGKKYKLWVINKYLASFRVHPASKSEKVREHFDEDLAIAKRHTQSGFMIGLHRLHNQLIILSYLRMQRHSHQHS